MSCEGTAIGAPLAEFKMLWDPNINSCASKMAAEAEWQVHGHLVAVKVGVECCARQRVKLQRLAFDQLGLECLDAQTVQRWCTVEQHRVSFHDILENVPHRHSSLASTIFLALFTVFTTPRSIILRMMKGL